MKLVTIKNLEYDEDETGVITQIVIGLYPAVNTSRLENWGKVF